MKKLQSIIEKHTQEIEPLEIASNTAWWDLAVSGDEKYAKKLKELRTQYRKVFTSPKNYQELRACQDPSDEILSRQRTLLLHQYRENQIPVDLIQRIVELETEIESIYTNFRGKVKGKALSNNDLKKILVDSDNSKDREEAWKASKLIGEQVEEKVKLLIKLRNESATKAGFTDFYSMRLELQELDQTHLFKLLKQLDILTSKHWDKYKTALDINLAKRFGVAVKDLKPWDYQDPFFQEAPSQGLNLDKFYEGLDLVEINKHFFSSIGLPVEDILKRSDLFERDKKNQHAFCCCIDRKMDIRVLCNMRENEYWMGTLLHELGHAVYDKFIDQKLPFFLRAPSHTSTTEAIAMLYGRLSKDGQFLQQYCNVDAKKAQSIDLQAKKQTAAGLLVFARWVLVMTHFEQAMYQQPDLNLNAFWWECVQKYQWVNKPARRNKPDWASKLHLACAPVYYQNYILGEMIASQLRHHLLNYLQSEKKSFYHSKQSGEWLKNGFFTLGARYPWGETVKKATGEELTPLYFAKDIEVAS